jgi:16S rRNA (uracil1498-N3)-methyltransferase
MRRLYVERIEPRMALSKEQSHYLRGVLRLENGAEIEVFDGRGARHLALFEGDLLRLGAPLPSVPPRALDVVLVQALAKGEKMDLIVQKATELGAARIVPLASERAVVKLSAGAARLSRWRRIAEEAARQSGRADVPRIDEPCGFDDLLRILREEPGRQGLILDPRERSLRLSTAARGLPQLLLAVGPEGGFSPAEVETARGGSMIPVALGPLVLRTETASLAALAVLLHIHGDLG